MSELIQPTQSWHEGFNNVRVPVNTNQKLMGLVGELSDEQARATLAEFLFSNPAFFFELVAGIRLFPMQELIIKGWARNDYNLAVWGRGVSKSWSVALFAIYWAIFNPGCRIVVVSFAFRASRRILEQCEKFVNYKDARLLSACFPKGLQKGTDQYSWTLPNGASIISLPLGDGTKIRGVRADLLIVDEFAYLPETIIGEILRPFLTANNKITEQLAIRDRENELIAQGVMDETQRTILDDRKKVIFLSSACYQFEHMYKRYCDWTDLLTKPEKAAELKKSGVSYFISRISYEACPDGLLNLKEIDEAKKDISEAMFDREYRAIFTGGSDGYFQPAKMQQCSIKDGDTPCLELVGERGAKYVVGIDVSLSGSETSDHFAMCVMKIVTRESDQRKLGMVVHSYAVAGGNLKDHILYFHYLLSAFNIIYVAIDASQGDEVEFINSCNQSKLFKDARIDLTSIEAEFKKEDHNDLPRQIRQSYNQTAGRIVQKQPFSSSFQKISNEWLQACFDHKGMLFAGKIAANSSVAGRYSSFDIGFLQDHESFRDSAGNPMGISAFIDNQDSLLELTRRECAMIQVKQTSLGTQQWDLPQHMKRSSGPNKVRKDSYSALLLCNWAVRLYLESQTFEVKVGMPDFPYMAM